MKTYISILRGINVSGQKKILMQDLKVLYENLGFEKVTTYIQSGNVIFQSNESLSTEFAKKIEEAVAEKYKFNVPVIVRKADEMQKVVESNPFLNEQMIDVNKLHVTFLSETPSQENLKKISVADFFPDRFIIEGKEVFLYIPEAYGTTKLSNTFFENKLKVSATTRNWKTVNKLAEMASA